MDPDHRYFPEPEDMMPHLIAFGRLMLAHASFEAEVRSLQSTIVGDEDFGEQPTNQWSVRERPRRIVELTKTHRKEHLGDATYMAKLLSEAIDPCDQRNRLAHGQWWCFNPQTSAVKVRRGTRRPGQVLHVDFTADDIRGLTEKFKTL